jgi:hypothetical protein
MNDLDFQAEVIEAVAVALAAGVDPDPFMDKLRLQREFYAAAGEHRVARMLGVIEDAVLNLRVCPQRH